MKLMIWVTASLLAIASAHAECITELPKHRTGYWHYRYEHGQKCWFGPRMEKHPEKVATELPTLRHSHTRDSGERRPTPIPSISKEIEEEVPDPVAFEARRVKIINVTNPPSISRRLEDAFEDIVKRCEVSLDACRDFK